jgi:hypothetical protein
MGNGCASPNFPLRYVLDSNNLSIALLLHLFTMYRYVFTMSGWVYPLGHVHFDVFRVFDMIRRVYPPFHINFSVYDMLGWIYPPPKMLISKFPTFWSG